MTYNTYTVTTYIRTKEFYKFNKDTLTESLLLHTGCFSKIETLSFKSELELKKFLKKHFPKTKSIWFYTHLNHALKNNTYLNYYITTINLESNISEPTIHFQLIPRKKINKYKKRKNRRYYDDMYYDKKINFKLPDKYFSC